MKVSLSDLLQTTRIAKADSVFIELSNSGGARLASRRSAFLHLVVEGQVLVGEEGLKTLTPVSAGDYVVSLSDRPQLLAVKAGARISQSDYFTTVHSHDAPPTLRFGVGGRSALVLTGAFHLPSVNPLLAVLPRQMVMRRAAAGALVNVQVSTLHSALRGPGATTLATPLIDTLFAQAVRSHADALVGSGLRTAKLGERFRIPVALSLIHSHPERRWTLASLAAEIGISRSTFAAEFTRVVGEPLGRYIHRLRMDRATEMLNWQLGSVAEVAWSVGYDSVESFTRAFREHFNTTPAAMRRALRQGDGDTTEAPMHWRPFLSPPEAGFELDAAPTAPTEGRKTGRKALKGSAAAGS